MELCGKSGRKKRVQKNVSMLEYVQYSHSCPQLLQKDPRDRLGSSVRDGEEVKEQEFFRPIDWDQIAKRAVPPPFRPVVVSVCRGNGREGRREDIIIAPY